MQFRAARNRAFQSREEVEIAVQSRGSGELAAFDKGGGVPDAGALAEDFVFAAAGEGAGFREAGGAGVDGRARVAVAAEVREEFVFDLGGGVGVGGFGVGCGGF